VKRIRIDRPRVRHDRPWREVLRPGPRDPDVVLAKALARAGNPGSEGGQQVMAASAPGALAGARRQDLRQVAGNGTRCQLQDHPHLASRRTGLGARS
jgi:hypothetical protein